MGRVLRLESYVWHACTVLTLSLSVSEIRAAIVFTSIQFTGSADGISFVQDPSGADVFHPVFHSVDDSFTKTSAFLPTSFVLNSVTGSSYSKSLLGTESIFLEVGGGGQGGYQSYFPEAEYGGGIGAMEAKFSITSSPVALAIAGNANASRQQGQASGGITISGSNGFLYSDDFAAIFDVPWEGVLFADLELPVGTYVLTMSAGGSGQGSIESNGAGSASLSVSVAVPEHSSISLLAVPIGAAYVYHLMHFWGPLACVRTERKPT